MPDHVVSQGECLSSIADKYGISGKTIWEDSRNAELRKIRLNPDTLFPGDVLFVPPITLKELDRVTDRRHKFVRKREMVHFRLRLLVEDKPRAYEAFTLEIGRFKYSGNLDADGEIDVLIPAGEPEGTLILNEGQERHRLLMGHIDPIDEVTGIQARLRNLAYLDGDLSGKWDEDSVEALRAFQRKNELSPTGKMDSATESMLKKEYGH